MKTAIDIKSEIMKTTFLENRTPNTTEQEESAAFVKLSKYENGAIFAGRFKGESPWESHPAGDEIVHVLEGVLNLKIIEKDGSENMITLSKDSLAVVPKSTWHKLISMDGVTLMTTTPLPTHLSVEYPIDTQSNTVYR